MSLARKCDVCGKLYEAYVSDYDIGVPYNGIAFVDKRTDSYVVKNIYDCCPECLVSIKIHLDDLKKGIASHV